MTIIIVSLIIGLGIFRLKWHPLMPLLYIAANLFVSFSIFMKQPGAALGGLGLFAAMGGIYVVPG